jgi:hypothetical protein
MIVVLTLAALGQFKNVAETSFGKRRFDQETVVQGKLLLDPDKKLASGLDTLRCGIVWRPL